MTFQNKRILGAPWKGIKPIKKLIILDKWEFYIRESDKSLWVHTCLKGYDTSGLLSESINGEKKIFKFQNAEILKKIFCKLNGINVSICIFNTHWIYLLFKFRNWKVFNRVISFSVIFAAIPMGLKFAT